MQRQTTVNSFLTLVALLQISSIHGQILELLAGGRSAGGGSGATTQATQPQVPSQPLIFDDQRLAIVYPVIQKFKKLITSDPFNITGSWVGADICKYRGFFCDNPPDNKSAIGVASVDFNGFQLSAATLSGFIDQLPDLALFHANTNNFSGIIPVETAKLSYLYELDLSNNKFSGSFPIAVLTMDDLTFLDIRFNFFSGVVPPELFASNLDFLFINNNNFMTKLSDVLNTTHLLYLTLANNKLFGPIPATIATFLSGLSEIVLLNNMLSGCLPYELGLLKQAVVLDVGNNTLTGPLPWSLGCLDNLEIFNVAGNLLYGSVPENLCRLGKLANLSLSDNYFTLAGPVCMSLIRSGVLDVKRNCIPGQPFQRSTAECAAFFAGQRYCPYHDTFSKIPCRFLWWNASTSPSPP